jgi:hypothetical protein
MRWWLRRIAAVIPPNGKSVMILIIMAVWYR